MVSIQKAVKQIMNFYRRPLPSICISFSSDDGKILFKEAMVNGQMENYFRLASQFRTQDEPAFCGLATLVMVLNALEIDPGRIWKGPWRWYHEDMLDCCIPLDTVKSKGITLDQFICISKCNGLTANVHRMSDNPNFDDFKQLLSRITKIDEEILVVSYSRKALGQTGSGHFASIGGYHPTKEMVLLFDTARFKYPPHWVPIDTLWQAMKDIDEETGRPRGYVTLTKDVDSSCLLLLSTSVALNEFMMLRRAENNEFSVLIEGWNEWLKETDQTTPEDHRLTQVVPSAVQWLLQQLLLSVHAGRKVAFPLTCHSHFSTEVSTELERVMSDIIKEVVECSIGTEVGKVISSLDPSDIKLLSENVFTIPKLHGCTLLILQDNLMKLTFLVSCWIMVNAPIRNVDHSISVHCSRGKLLQKLSCQIIFAEFCLQSQMELVQLSNKIAKMYSCYNKVSCCSDWACGSTCLA